MTKPPTNRFYRDRMLRSFPKKPAPAPQPKQKPAPKHKPKPADGDRQ